MAAIKLGRNLNGINVVAVFVLSANMNVLGDSPASPGIILPHALDEVDFLWHLGSRRTGDVS